MPTANNTRALWPLLVIVVAALAAGSCSTSNTTSGLSLVDEQGNHPANWLSRHPVYAVADSNQCKTCHGDDLAGGIANTSCYNAACHHGMIPGWVATRPAEQPHGKSAKKLTPGSFGFVSCQICHEVDFSGGGAQVPCLNVDCHGGAGQSPHPAEWRPLDSYFHTDTDGANAPVCAQCHLNGKNSPIAQPSPPAAPGTPPGCFNSTLCHGENPVPHPLRSDWVAAPPASQPHGNSAKATPSDSSGFAFCRVCHGTADGNFNGGTARVSCLNNGALCHGDGVQSPHAPQWFQGDAYEHITTDPGNASECAFCHFGEQKNAGNHSPVPPPEGSNPDCFNGSLCHGKPFDVHPAGWFVRSPAPQPHGQTAKATVSGLPGFEFCRLCHGTSDGNFDGGGVQFSCLIVACHGGGGLSPHAAQWLPEDTYVHVIGMDVSNASECAFCHFDSPNNENHLPRPPPAGSDPGCFNNTLCHGGG